MCHWFVKYFSNCIQTHYLYARVQDSYERPKVMSSEFWWSLGCLRCSKLLLLSCNDKRRRSWQDCPSWGSQSTSNYPVPSLRRSALTQRSRGDLLFFPLYLRVFARELTYRKTGAEGRMCKSGAQANWESWDFMKGSPMWFRSFSQSRNLPADPENRTFYDLNETSCTVAWLLSHHPFLDKDCFRGFKRWLFTFLCNPPLPSHAAERMVSVYITRQVFRWIPLH